MFLESGACVGFVVVQFPCLGSEENRISAFVVVLRIGIYDRTCNNGAAVTALLYGYCFPRCVCMHLCESKGNL